jgi:hypothetical protein
MILSAIFLLIQQQSSNEFLIGRFEIDGAGGYACEWPGSAIRISTKSKTVVAHFRASTPDDRWQIDIDGKPSGILKLEPKVENYTITLPDANLHTVMLVRRTEAFAGKTVYFRTDGSTAPWRGSTRRIHVIGDSISAGYGVDGAKKEEHYSVETSNAYMTYGWIAARELKADCTIVAWSGRKMWPDNTIPEVYDYNLPNEKVGKPRDWADAVVINLATNDFGQKNPDKNKWCDAYRAFVIKIRSKFPKAHIYLATGSMMSDNWPPNQKPLSTLKDYLDTIVNTVHDDLVHRIDFAPQDEKDGIGSDWHPNAVTHGKMAKVLVDALRKDLGWK